MKERNFTYRGFNFKIDNKGLLYMFYDDVRIYRFTPYDVKEVQAIDLFDEIDFILEDEGWLE